MPIAPTSSPDRTELALQELRMLCLEDARTLAHRQFALDSAITEHVPGLVVRKLSRMAASPHAFLRGSAGLFYGLLKSDPWLFEGPRGEGWITGDMHIENFGAFRTGNHAEDDHEASDQVTFDLNDFDEACVAPQRLDVLRLVTSLLLGAREFGASGPVAVDMASGVLSGYGDALFREKLAERPACVESLVARVRGRSRKQFLEARTEVVHSTRRFSESGRYRRLGARAHAEVVQAFEAFAKGRADVQKDALEVVDVAFRVAGTGSLGTRRYAVLVRGKGGKDGGWIFDMKEQGDSAVAGLATAPPKGDGAARVLSALSACLERPPRMVGSTMLGASSMLVRRLSPQEDKLDLSTVSEAERVPLARYLGCLAGRAHRAGATALSAAEWTKQDWKEVLDKGIALAAIHEGAYLAYCRLIAEAGRYEAG